MLSRKGEHYTPYLLGHPQLEVVELPTFVVLLVVQSVFVLHDLPLRKTPLNNGWADGAIVGNAVQL